MAYAINTSTERETNPIRADVIAVFAETSCFFCAIFDETTAVPFSKIFKIKKALTLYNNELSGTQNDVSRSMTDLSVFKHKYLFDN